MEKHFGRGQAGQRLARKGLTMSEFPSIDSGTVSTTNSVLFCLGVRWQGPNLRVNGGGSSACLLLPITSQEISRPEILKLSAFSTEEWLVLIQKFDICQIPHDQADIRSLTRSQWLIVKKCSLKYFSSEKANESSLPQFRETSPDSQCRLWRTVSLTIGWPSLPSTDSTEQIEIFGLTY